MKNCIFQTADTTTTSTTTNTSASEEIDQLPTTSAFAIVGNGIAEGSDSPPEVAVPAPVAPPPVAAETNYQEQSVQLAKNTTTVTVVPPPTTKPVIAVTPIPNFGKAQSNALFANFVNANGQGQCKNFDFSTLVLPTSTPSARHQQSAVKKQHVAKKPIATATNQITKPKQ